MTRPRILVINPNSNESVTEGLRRSLAEFTAVAEIECCTLEEGPFGIESDDDVAAVKPLVVDRIAKPPQHDAYVIACYSDPGLAECRERFDKPVNGMQRSAIETAVATGGRFGVLALSDESIARHLPYISQLGFDAELAGEVALDISVDEAANDPDTLSKVVAAGRRLIEERGANVLILGCAGMADLREPAEAALSTRVIEPARAAVRQALDQMSARVPGLGEPPVDG